VTLVRLNSTAVANAGAGLVTTCTGAVGAAVVSLFHGLPVEPIAVLIAFLGIIAGAALCYVGRPSTIPPLSATSAGTATATAGPTLLLHAETERPMPPTLPGEIADGLVAALESPAAQAALVTAITAGEVELQSAGDSIIANAKGAGVLGVVIAAGKGSVEAEFNAELAKLPPTAIAAYLTGLAVQEAKALGG
jgi:hypothetical protein